MQITKRTTSELLARRPRLRPFIARVSLKYGGHRHKELERFLKFAFVGMVGTVVDLGVTNFLTRIIFHVNKDNGSTLFLAASTIGFIMAVSNNFVWNRYWTYPDSRSYPVLRQLAQFFAVNALGLLIRVFVIALLSLPFAALIGSLPQAFLSGLAITKDLQALLGGDMALLVAIGVVMLWNFFVNRYWTYNDVK
jgi:putative flippase GtrA